MIIPVQGGRVTLTRPLAYGAKIAVCDLSIKSSKGGVFDNYKLTIINMFSATEAPMTTDFTLPVGSIPTFKAFKEGLFKQTLKIKNKDKNRIIREIILRFSENEGKFYLNSGTQKFKMTMNTTLSAALGLTHETYTVRPKGDLYPEEPFQKLIFFHKARNDGILCEQVDLTNHLDINTFNFNFKKYHEGCVYIEAEELFYFSLTPGAHRVLTFNCGPEIYIECLTVHVLEE